MVSASDLPVETVREGTSATDMAETIFGKGVTVVGATYCGDADSAGIYSGGTSASPGVAPSDTGIIMSTGRAEEFTNSSGHANQGGNATTDTWGADGDWQYNGQAGTQTFDASTLDVDFIPDTDLMTMQFVFSSEEYPEFENSIYTPAPELA